VIKLYFKDSSFEISIDSKSTEIFNPLHKMYFESNLSANYDIKNNKYIVPSKSRDIECFDKIIDYLEHYGFDYELDNNAVKLKEEKDSAEKNFKEKLGKDLWNLVKRKYGFK